MDITTILEERGKRYGDFMGHAEITVALKRVINSRCSAALAADQQEALDMICHKIGRIINGDPNYADSWRDIAGYATLVADRLDADEPAAPDCDPIEQQQRHERLEELYEADGRHDPAHPKHGLYSGLVQAAREQEVEQ